MIEFLKANKMFYFNIIFTKIYKFIEETKKYEEDNTNFSWEN